MKSSNFTYFKTETGSNITRVSRVYVGLGLNHACFNVMLETWSIGLCNSTVAGIRSQLNEHLTITCFSYIFQVQTIISQIFLFLVKEEVGPCYFTLLEIHFSWCGLVSGLNGACSVNNIIKISVSNYVKYGKGYISASFIILINEPFHAFLTLILR